MLIPIGTDVRARGVPGANVAIVALNVLIFLITDTNLGGMGGARLKDWGSLDPSRPMLYQYVTYQFLHGDFWHLAGNMLFLWIFGNAVNDRLGSLAYSIFYLAGGIFAGVVFAATADNLIIGASGAIASVTTAFLTLYPRVHITMLFWLVVVFTFPIPATVLIVVKIILWDNVIAPYIEQGSGVTSNVAYSAHLGGYLFGFVVVVALLLLRALPRNQFDLLALWDRWNRRTGLLPSGVGAGRPLGARPVRVQELSSRPLAELQPSPVSIARGEITDLIARGQLADAAEKYLALLKLDSQHVLPEKQQIEVATFFATRQRYADAARAYENLVSAYPAALEIHQIRLLLGIIYRRHLGRPDLAAPQLRAALYGLAPPQQRQIAEDELSLAESGVSG